MFVPQNKCSGACFTLSSLNCLSSGMHNFNVHKQCTHAIQNSKVFLMHSIILSRILSFFFKHPGNMSGKCRKLFFSFCCRIAIVFLMQTTMFHQQVQQQELCSFVSDTFGVSGAPGGVKDRSVLSLTSCCLLTFAHAHYYIIVTQCCSVPISPHSRYNVRAVFGFVQFFGILLDSLPNGAQQFSLVTLPCSNVCFVMI